MKIYHAILLACFVSAVNFSLGFLAGKDSVKQPAPIVAQTNATWASNPVIMQRAALSVGCSLGYEAASRGATLDDLRKLKDAFESHQLSIVKDWFDTHPAK